VAGRIGFRWRQVVHDLGSGLLFRPAVITGAIADVYPRGAVHDAPPPPERHAPVLADRPGYLQLVDYDGLAPRARAQHHAELVRAGLSAQFLPDDRRGSRRTSRWRSREAGPGWLADVRWISEE